MVQANMLEAKTELSKLVKMLESGQEDVVYIARNNVPIVQMTLVDLPKETKRIGVAKGRFSLPDDFDAWDDEVEDMFEALA
ncbi:MAG TPA: toxin-antitoxin system, antitoxin component, PHD family protein [Candidatus Aphodovivens excrementavium]|nr:toxin-antitoxin system, antitoxin component, PHD family protein [Candidatus Aphodovivens excrementavium]